jgi:hypothetical protein
MLEKARIHLLGAKRQKWRSWLTQSAAKGCVHAARTIFAVFISRAMDACSVS